MELTDIMPKEDWVKVQNELHEKFGLNADIMNTEGKRLDGNTWGNELCHAIREDKKGLGAICVPAGQMFVQMMKEGKPFYEECDAGMVRIAVPIKKDGELVGSAGGCGLVVGDGEVDEFTIGMMSDLSEDEIAEKNKTVQTVTEEKVQEIMDYIQKRIDEATA